jgi:PAS domain S-box-containing protein
VGLEEAHRRLRTILDCQDATIVVIDMETLKVLFANARLRRELGFDPVGQVCWRTLLPGLTGPCSFCNNDQLVDEAGQPTGICQWEWLNPRTNSWVSLRDQAIPWDGGRLVRFEIAYDIDDLKRTEEALRQSEERYRSLITLSPVPILVHHEGRIAFVNPAAERILTTTWPDQLIGLPILDLVEPSQRTRAAERILWALERNQALPPQEFDVLCLDGRRLVVESTGLPITFEGRPSVLTVWQDVTERNRAMADLKASEERYRNLLHLSPVPTMVHRQGVIVYANPATERLLGARRPDDILGRLLFDFARPEELPLMMERTRQIIDEGRPVPPQEFKVLRLDGLQVEVECTGGPIVYEGQPAVLLVWQDVTERNRAMADLKTSEERYRDLFNSITDLIFTLDPEGRFLSVNPALLQLLGCGREEILGRTPADFMRSEYREAFFTGFLPQVMAEGQAQGVTGFYTLDGAKRYIEYRTVLARPESGSPYISCTGRDVTDRILAERELSRLQEQLLQSQKLEAVGTLAGGVAHDFNNILQVLSGYLQLLEAEPGLPAASRKASAEMTAAVDRAAELVRRLLAFSRKEKREVKPLDLNAEINQAIKILGRLMPKMIRLETDLAPEPGWINGSSAQLEQVLLNLAANARDAMPEDGVLTFTTRNVRVDEAQARAEVGLPAGEYVLLTVTDTGQGMDQATQAHLFEPFFTTKGVGQGTGLGLSTVYGIVKDHGGHVTCHSQVGQGTVFSIYLPRLPDQTVERSVASDEEEVRGGRETILVVDDEPAIRDVAAETLGQAGYTVLVAASGEEALEVQGRARPDLIIMDLGMPGMGGLKCIRELKDRDPRPRILVSSGYAAITQIQASLEAGAQGYVSKPYRLKEMLRQVREVLDGEG